jgi:hypothetical protein
MRVRGDLDSDGDEDAGTGMGVTGFGDGREDRAGVGYAGSDVGLGGFCPAECVGARVVPQAPAASVSTRIGLRNSDIRIRRMRATAYPRAGRS